MVYRKPLTAKEQADRLGSEGFFDSAAQIKSKLALELARAEVGAGGKSVSDKDVTNATKRIENMSPDQVRRLIQELKEAGATGGRGMQYGGMADMSAAPMVKQPQTKKRKASGFRAKYSKGGGVRKSKYSL